MKSSIQIHNELRDLDERIAKAQADFNAAEGDAKDAFRDAINQYTGEQKALSDLLGDVLEAEDKVRRSGGVPLADPSGAAFKPKNLAQALLGDPAGFKGLQLGQSIALDEYQDFKLKEHADTDYSLPSQYAEQLPNFGVLSSLPTAKTDKDSVSFYEADPELLSNAAGTWVPGKAIQMSGMGWKQRSFHMEQVANGMPVLENNLSDYNELSTIINDTLVYMQELAKASRVLRGSKDNAETGIVGILEHENIQKFTKVSTDTIADAAYKMATDVFLATGFYPTTLAMHPYVAEAVNLEKDKNGRYINQMVNGKLWALSVVPDLNLSETAESKTTYGMLAYWPNAATFYTKMGEKLEYGLVNDQFLRNEKTIRINGQYGLKVTFPKCFSYLADTGVAGR